MNDAAVDQFVEQRNSRMQILLNGLPVFGSKDFFKGRSHLGTICPIAARPPFGLTNAFDCRLMVCHILSFLLQVTFKSKVNILKRLANVNKKLLDKTARAGYIRHTERRGVSRFFCTAASRVVSPRATDAKDFFAAKNFMEKKFKRALGSLDEVFDFINGFVANNQIDNGIAFSINLAVEELFTNMIKYNPGNPSDVAITVEKDQKDLTVILIDSDAEPFDVTKIAEVDVAQSLQARPIGGLGLHLVKKMVDQVDYEYANRQSKISLIKHLEQ